MLLSRPRHPAYTVFWRLSPGSAAWTPALWTKIFGQESVYQVEILDCSRRRDVPYRFTGTNAAEVATWHRNNARLYSLLYLATEGLACVTVKQHKARPTAGAKADGAAAWTALAARYDGNTKQACLACRENLLHAFMKSGRDPSDYIAVVAYLRLRLEDTGEMV